MEQDNERLAEAESLARRLREYQETEQAEIFPELIQRAQQLEHALRRRAHVVAHPAPRIAFIAHKGVGKSTLINTLADLWIEDTPPSPDATSKQLNQQAILPLGNGGTTPCEIRLEVGPWGILVEPEDAGLTLFRIRQFAEWAWYKAHRAIEEISDSVMHQTDDAGLDDEPTGVSPPRLQRDVERVVRGITGLQELISSSRNATGRRLVSGRTDQAEELARSFPDKDAFVNHVSQLARLPDRRRRQWLPDGDPRRWLRETLLNLVEGKLQEQPFPRYVTVQVPTTGITWRQSAVILIDTLGLPAVATGKPDGPDAEVTITSPRPLAEREDLRDILKDSWTLVVVGSQFNEPPAPSVELLRQMTEEVIHFGEALEDRTVVVIVDPGRAGSGPFADAETERAQKEERCAENLVALGCPRGHHHPRWRFDEAVQRALCVNVLDGGREQMRAFLEDKLERLAATHNAKLSTAMDDAVQFFRSIDNQRRQTLRQAVVESFKHHLTPLAEDQLGTARMLRANPLARFASECFELHPATLRSVIVNRGRGSSQNAWSLLESATTLAMQAYLLPLQERIDGISRALRLERKYHEQEAEEVIREEADRRRRATDDFFVMFLQELVASVKARLAASGDLWNACEDEWGRGIRKPGYKERVAGHIRAWGVAHSPSILGDLVESARTVSAEDSGYLRNLFTG